MTINYINWEVLYGKTLQEVEQKDDDKLIFTFTDGSKFTLYHDYQCCEHVRLEDIIYVGGEPSKKGTYSAYYGMMLYRIEKVEIDDKTCTSTIVSLFWKRKDNVEWYDEPNLLTTYWIGTSNGYYSERVDYIIEPAPSNWETLYGKVVLSTEVIKHAIDDFNALEQDDTVVLNFSDGYVLHLLPVNMQMITNKLGTYDNSNNMLWGKTLLEVWKDPNRNKLILTFTENTTLTLFYEELEIAVMQRVLS